MGIYGDSWKINMAAPEDEFWDMPDMHSHMYHTRLESARIWDISSFWLFSEGFAALLECKMAIENPNPDFFWTINYVFRCMVLRHPSGCCFKEMDKPSLKISSSNQSAKASSAWCGDLAGPSMASDRPAMHFCASESWIWTSRIDCKQALTIRAYIYIIVWNKNTWNFLRLIVEAPRLQKRGIAQSSTHPGPSYSALPLNQSSKTSSKHTITPPANISKSFSIHSPSSSSAQTRSTGGSRTRQAIGKLTSRQPTMVAASAWMAHSSPRALASASEAQTPAANVASRAS